MSDKEEFLMSNIAVVEANRKNVLAIRDYSTSTRAMLRDQLEVMKDLTSAVRMCEERIVRQQEEIQALRMKVYTGGPTSGD